MKFSLPKQFFVSHLDGSVFQIRPIFFLLILSFGLGTAACTEKSSDPAALKQPSAEKGQTIYRTYCTACHNSDPKKPGTLGPEIFGASKELLEARILTATYPEGYKPKRETKTMPPFPYLKNDIPSLHLYLNSTKE